MPEPQIEKFEKGAKEVINTFQSGQSGDFFRNFWETHQGEILHFGKILLLVLLVILLAWGFTRIVRALIRWKGG